MLRETPEALEPCLGNETANPDKLPRLIDL